MRIVITGSPGTGKSLIARELADMLSLELVDLKKVVREKKLLGKGQAVDVKKLANALVFLRKKDDYVVEGHLACEMRLPADFVFVLRTKPSELRKRLAKRRYGKRKLEENLMAEMLDYCTQRVRAEYGKEPLELETGGRMPETCARTIARAIKQKKKKLDRVSYSKELMAYLKLRGSG
ncbi:MAG: AAA family ATPase [Candidatus Micrarchaeota archaeon]